MTLDEFLAKLRETPRTWRSDYGRLRNSDHSCPLTAVAGIKGSSQWHTAATKLHMAEDLASRIVLAADGARGEDWREIREWLNLACSS